MNNFLKVLMVLTLATPFFANADKGIGFMLGQPTGLSARVDLDSETAWDGLLAWRLGNDSYLSAHVNRLWLKPKSINLDGIKLDSYFGVGGIIFLPSSDLGLALRVPGGFSYKFQNPNLECFAELAIAFSVIPETDFDVVGGLGLRYWFN